MGYANVWRSEIVRAKANLLACHATRPRGMLTEPVALLAEDLGNYLHCSSGNALRSPLRHPRFTALGQADFETAFRNAAAISRLAHPRLLCSARPVGVLRPG